MNRPKRLARHLLCKQLLSSTQFLPMKFFMLLGGFFGFAITLAASTMAGCDLWWAVFQSSLGCMVGAYLFRMFRKVVAASVREVAVQKARSRVQEAALPS